MSLCIIAENIKYLIAFGGEPNNGFPPIFKNLIPKFYDSSLILV